MTRITGCVKVGIFGSRRALSPPSKWCSKGLHLITGHNGKKERGGQTCCRACSNRAQFRREWAELLEGRTGA